jgi:hypothetical protein
MSVDDSYSRPSTATEGVSLLLRRYLSIAVRRSFSSVCRITT